MKLFSIIIPYYDDFERLIKLLNCLNDQTFEKEKWEVIVVNNEPVNPKLKLPNFSFPVSVVNESIPGSYAARNKGIKESKGKILGFTDSDCLPDRNWLTVANETFEQDFKNEIGILSGPVKLFYKNPKQFTDAEVYEKYTAFTTESYAKEGHAITANWFSYKSVIEEFGGFDANLKSNGDSELSGKISQKYQLVYNPDLVVQHPSRFYTYELVGKYRRILGGTYTRKYQDYKIGFLGHTMNFIFRRYRFSLKKFFTVPFYEAWAIFKVCNSINLGAIREYFSLIIGGETKR